MINGNPTLCLCNNSYHCILVSLHKYIVSSKIHNMNYSLIGIRCNYYIGNRYII